MLLEIASVPTSNSSSSSGLVNIDLLIVGVSNPLEDELGGGGGDSS